ncbi:hypothetical protein CHS0354_028836 [Potamilus streckersoni]|uniref:Reverse transcriptase/retrotransposon-derived protein RNase H-like domain-containing protein n=1 Tax=Potamilus streckersoni TaxID=2493646 RepID=A0AAE0TFW1_9BIVA|nr:hypothetical protein CHS0354_028836 [Potamilus streckersoni]
MEEKSGSQITKKVETGKTEFKSYQSKCTRPLNKVIAVPNFIHPLILDTDASGEAIGAVLSQNIDGKERLVTFLWSLPGQDRTPVL